jgi:L-lactate dehydrogenase complex protein LldE
VPGLVRQGGFPLSSEAVMHVGLFVTCLIDLLRPDIGLAVVKVLEKAGCTVEFFDDQTCCGQPNWNAGDRRGAQALALRMLDLFEGCDTIVVPSGSCAATIKTDYPALFPDDPHLRVRFDALAARTFEFTDFLARIGNVEGGFAGPPRHLTYHDSCSGLRYLGVRDQPRRLIAQVQGARLTEMKDCDRCCGFGGAFSVKYSEVSAAIADDKCAAIRATGADAVVMGDLGCMMQIEGRLRRQGDDRTQVLHIAQVLAGDR